MENAMRNVNSWSRFRALRWRRAGWWWWRTRFIRKVKEKTKNKNDEHEKSENGFCVTTAYITLCMCAVVLLVS